ncbi:MAG: hypothetical protein R3C61_14915 [Bacteroidia bacterium]
MVQRSRPANRLHARRPLVMGYAGEMPDGIYLYELRTEAQEVLAQGKIVVQK